MAVKHPPKPVNMTLNLAPMVDVMMCLIIFFLLASKLVEQERYAVKPAWAVAASEVKPGDLGSRVTINVRRASDSDEKAEYVVVDWDGQQIRERVLQPSDVEGLLTLRARRAAAENQKLRCVINADRMVMYQHVEVVLRACGLAKISDIVFMANKGLEPKEGA
jgi:biopolymer transport protein ExbD